MPKINNLSVAILVLNGEKTIEKTLKSVEGWTEEIVVGVDDKTNDRTKEIVSKYTDKFWEIKHRDNFDINKEEVILKAKNDWVLLLDADEYVDEELKKEIELLLEDGKKIENLAAFEIPRKNIVLGKWIEYTGWYPDYQIRLFRKNNIKFNNEKLHQNPKVSGNLSKLQSNIWHDNYQSISQFLERLNKYTTVEAKTTNINFSKLDLIKKPLDEFIKRFIVCQGYKDGIHGLALSFLQAFYELVVILKVWEANKFKQEKVELKEVEDEFKKGMSSWKWWKEEEKIKQAKSKIEENFYKGKRKLGL